MAQRKETVGIVQLEWICPNCKSRNPGPKKNCESCGAPQPENVKFERAADEKIITDENAVRSAKAGADIHCGFCGTRNPVNATNCSQCGGDLKEGKARQAGQILQAAPPAPKVILCGNCGSENPGTERKCATCGAPLPRAGSVEQPRPAPVQASVAPALRDQNKKPNWLAIGGVGALLALCCAAILFLFVFPTKSVQGAVTDVNWQTSIPVQEVQAVYYNDQTGNPPSEAYNVSCRTESREICEDKTIDQGNGFAEVVRECHTEDTDYCSYTVDEWKTVQSYDLSGNDLFPVYADPSISNDQRVGSSSESYSVTFNTPDGVKTYAPDTLAEFQQFQTGTMWTLNMNAMGGILSVER